MPTVFALQKQTVGLRPPKLSGLHLGANGRSRLKWRLGALSGKLRFGNYAEASFV